MLSYRCPQQITIHTPLPPIVVGEVSSHKPQQPLRKGEGSVHSRGHLGGSRSPSLGLSSSTPALISKPDTAVSSLGQESAAESQQGTSTGLEPGGRPLRPFSEPQFLVGSKNTGSGSRHTTDPTPHLLRDLSISLSTLRDSASPLEKWGHPAFLAGHCEDSSCLPFLT